MLPRHACPRSFSGVYYAAACVGVGATRAAVGADSDCVDATSVDDVSVITYDSTRVDATSVDDVYVITSNSYHPISFHNLQTQ